MSETDVRSYIAGLIEKARAAQKVAERFTQEQVDRLAGAVCYEIYHNKELIRELAEFAMEETELGDVPSKIGKVTGKCRAMWHYGGNPRKGAGSDFEARRRDWLPCTQHTARNAPDCTDSNRVEGERCDYFCAPSPRQKDKC